MYIRSPSRLQRYSQSVISINVTAKSDLLYANGNIISLHEDSRVLIPMFMYRLHSYLNATLFYAMDHEVLRRDRRVLSSAAVAYLSTEKVKAVMNKVLNHFYGHDTYTDIRTVLERNKHWSEEVDA